MLNVLNSLNKCKEMFCESSPHICKKNYGAYDCHYHCYVEINEVKLGNHHKHGYYQLL